MKPTKLKTSKEINMSQIFLDFISSNYGPQAITPNLQNYFSDFNKNRIFVGYKKDDMKSIKDITNALKITTKYFNQLIAIKSKMNFGLEHKACKIDFFWSDTISGDTRASNNINFEYYNVLFNIASLYFYLAYQKCTSLNVDKALRKEAIKDYKRALYLFNIIRDEAVSKIDPMELPSDLTPSYCDYCATICIIYGQIEIVKIAEETTPNDYALRGKLLMGISENYKKAYLLSGAEPTKNGGTDTFRNYLNNRSHYYKSLVYKKISEINMKKFDDTGLGYGEATVYQQLSIQELDECAKTINICEGIEADKFNLLYMNEKKIEAKMSDLAW